MGEGELFGYGCWALVEATLDGEPMEMVTIPWFGVAREFQGARTANDESVARQLYATVEADALGHDDTPADALVDLVCHEDNTRGLAFWRRLGFRFLEVNESPSGRYHRFIK